ncbi:MAG: hypothetical protein RLN79_13390 [Cytophagales bacterium]
MRKYYFLIVLALIVANTNAQVTISNGANIFLSTGSIFSTDMDVTLNGNAVITNNGDFDAGSMILNNTGIFNNNNGASFDLLTNISLNNTSQFINNTGATALITDSTIVSSTLANTGSFESRYFDILSGGFAQNGGTFQIQNAFVAFGGATVVTNTGELAFVGNDNNKRINTDAIGANLLVRKIAFNAGLNTNLINLESVVHVSDTADFNSGRVQYGNSATDSLVVLNGGLVTMDSVSGNGLMANALYRYPGGANEFMRFPVGDASGNFRPFWINGVQYSGSNPKIGVEYLGARTVANNNVVGYNASYNTNSWGFSILENTLDPSVVQVQYATADGVTQTQSVVAEGFEIVAGDTIFFNLGQGPNSTTITGGGVVESLVPAQGNSVIMIGQSTELKLRIRAVLEGAISSGIIMGVDPVFRDTLRNIYEFGGNTSKPMLLNKVVPVTAVDSIKIYLRSGLSGTLVDSSSAWLMSDGSIRDYVTGDSAYAVFTNAAFGNYYIVLKHRNHIEIQSNSAVSLSNVPNAVPFDFTNSANIYGGGGYKIIGASAVVAAGNSNEDGEVNALDYSEVLNAQNPLTQGYVNTDVLFSDATSNPTEVDIDDLNKVNQNSSILYFSTVP